MSNINDIQISKFDKIFLKIVVGWYDKITKTFLLIVLPIIFSVVLWLFIHFQVQKVNSFWILLLIFTFALINVLIIARFIFKNKKILFAIYYFFLSAIFQICFFASIFFNYGISNCSDNVCGFLTYFYFSIVTWTTLGYGDFQPLNESRLFAGLEAMSGYIYMGILVGIITAGIQIKYSTEQTP